MPYCPKCDMEFVEGIKVCSDCGGPLVESKEVADTMKQKEKEEQLAVMAQEMDPFSGEMAKTEDADPDEISSAKKKPADEIVHAYVDKGQRYEDMSSSASAFFLVGGVLAVGAALNYRVLLTGDLPRIFHQTLIQERNRLRRRSVIRVGNNNTGL